MNQATRRTKETVENCLERADRLRQEGKLDEAIDVYQRAIELDPNSYLSYHYRGEILAQKDDLSAAASFYLLALEINPDYCWSYHCLGLVLFWQGKYNKAIASARQAIEIEPKRATFHYHLGLYLEHKLELDSAITAYSKALELEPNLTEARSHLEAVLNQQTESPQNRWSRDVTDKKDKVGIDLKTLLSQGKVLMDKGDIDNAIAVYHQGIDLDANSYECYHFLGKTLAQKNELEKAEKCYRQAIKINPSYYWSYHCLGQVLFWQGQLDEAISAACKAIEIEPNQATFHYHLGLYLERKLELDSAISSYQQAIKLNPSLPDFVYSRLTDLMLQQSQLDAALDLCRDAIRHSPKSSELYFNYGKALTAKNLWQDAAASYTKAVELQPNYWDAYQSLGDVLSQLDRGKEAQQAYQSAETEFYQFQEFNQSDIPDDFDWQVYLALNSDLKITSKFDAITHFMVYGLAENKLYALKHLHDPQKIPDIAPQSIIEPTELHGHIKPPKLAVLVHIYYFDLWSELSSRIKNIESEFDLLINIVASIWQPEMHEQIRTDFPKAKILISPNRGRDIGGHLFLMAHFDLNQYDLFCLLHTKKSPHINPMVSNIWRQDLLDAILGTKEKAQHNLAIMNQNPHIGLMGSRYWRNTAIADNVENYQHLLAKLAIKPTAQNCEYLSGTMMLIRPQIMQIIYDALRDVELETGDKKELSFHIDGQMAHALERIIGNLVRDQGLDFFWQE